MGEFVDEGLEDEAERVRSRRAQRSGRHAQRHQRHAVVEIVDKPRRELVRLHRRRVSDPIAMRKRHEMVAERDQLAVAVEPALEKMKARRPVEIVLDVVLPVPQQLYRGAHGLGDPGRLDHEIVAQASAEPAAAAGHVNRDVALPGCRGWLPPAWRRVRGSGSAPRSPPCRPGHAPCNFAARAGCAAGKDRNRRPRQHALHRRARLSRRHRCARIWPGLPLASCGRIGGIAGAALLGGRALVPGDLELVAGLVRGPPVLGDNGDPVDQPLRVVAALDDKRVMYARQRFDRVGIGADHLAAKDRAFLEHRIKHAGPRDIDAEQRLAGHDQRVVDRPASTAR